MTTTGAFDDALLESETKKKTPSRLGEPIALHGNKEAIQWNPVTRIAFRFAFAYFSLYWITYLSTPLWARVVSWVGFHVLRLGHSVTYTMNGSGDSMYSYVLVLCSLLLALITTAIWLWLDHGRPNYSKLHQWLRGFLRLALGSMLLLYGAAKVIPTQMPPPSLSTLMETYGQSSPMRLLWTLMGASRGYNIFAGGAEMLAGILLFVPGCTTLAALIAIGVMSNVFMLNMCYDVPVKLFSFHLLLMAAFLAAPDARRLANLFLFGRKVELFRGSPLFQRRWLNRAAVALSLTAGLLLTVASLYSSHSVMKFVMQPIGAPLYGVWSAEEYAVDGKTVPPSPASDIRWQRAFLERPWALIVDTTDGLRHRFILELDEKKKTLGLTVVGDQKPAGDLTYQTPQPNLLTLSGRIDGHRVDIRLRRLELPKSFLLTGRGFHWINEYPLNQ